jgi:hypothetical protein
MFCRQLWVTKPEPLHRAWTLALQENIALRNELADDTGAFGRLEIYSYALLAAIADLVKQALTTQVIGGDSTGIVTGKLLYVNNLGPELGQQSS